MSTSKRPRIPTHIYRRVLVEAGHRCAIPTCRYIEVDVHHIVPWEKCKAHRYENLIALCSNCHRRAGSGDIDRKSLRLYKLNLRFAHDKYSQLELDILFELYKIPSDKVIPWPSFMRILLKRIAESGLIKITPATTGISLNGLEISEDTLVITTNGRLFVKELGIHDYEKKSSYTP